MLKFIKISRKIIIATIVTVLMLATISPIIVLGANDGKAPEFIENESTKSGTVLANQELKFKFKDDDSVSYIFYAWNRRVEEKKSYETYEVKDEELDVNYEFKTKAPETSGIYEFSIAAQDYYGNITNWINIPYVVVDDEDDLKEDSEQPVFSFNTPDEYPIYESEIEQGREITFNVSDKDSGIYYVAYRWIAEKDWGKIKTADTFIYKQETIKTEAPNELGVWYLVMYARDGSNNVSDTYYTKLKIVDKTAPTLTLKGDEKEYVSLGETYTDPGATFSDNCDATKTIYSENTIDTSILGVQTLTYTTTDIAGNTSNTLTRNVVVTGTQITVPTKTEYNLNQRIDLTGATIKTCDETGIVTDVTPTESMFTNFATTTPGSYEATFTYNNISMEYSYTVLDKQTPVYTIPTGLTATYGQTLADVRLPEGFTFEDNSTTKVGNAGTNKFLVTYTPDDTNIYATVTGIEIEIEVSKAIPTVPELPTLTATYGDTLADVELPEGFAFNDKLTTKVGNAGTKSFFVTYTPTDTDNYEPTLDVVEIEISKATIDISKEVEFESVTIPYDGEFHKIILTGELPAEIAEIVEITYETNVRQTVGTTDAKAIFKIKDEYKNNYNEIEPMTATLTIEKGTPVVPEIGTLTAVYGDTLADVELELPGGFTFEDNSTTKVGNAGTNKFTVKYTPSNTNYAEVTGIEVEIEVSKATPTVPTISTLTATYGDTLADVIDQLPEKLTFKDELTTKVGNVGYYNDFELIYTPDDTDNYEVVDNIWVDIEVSKAVPTYAIPAGLTAIYGDTLEDIELPERFSFQNELTTVLENVGTNKFMVTYMPVDTDNYETVTGIEVEIEVSKATPTVPTISTLTATYGDTLADIELPEGFSFQDESTTVLENIGINKFMVTYMPVDKEHFETVEDIEIVITVEKSTPEYKTEIHLTATYGDTLADVVDQLPKGYEFAEELTTKVGETAGTTCLHTATYTPEDKEHYETIDYVEVLITVEKATYDMTGVKFEDQTFEYNGKYQAITITGELPEGVTVEYKSNKRCDVGSRLATAEFKGDTTNYNEIAPMTATITIIKANYDLSGLTFADKTVTYNGKVQGLAVEGLPEGVTVSYENNNNINAGTYTVTAKFTVTDNYNPIADMTATLTIEKADYITDFITFADKTVTYNGEVQKLEAIYLPMGVTVSYENNENVDAGTYTVIAKFAGDTDNYNAIPDMEATLTINKATYDMTAVTFAGKTVTYDGNVQKLAVEGLPEGVTAIYENNENINAGTYTVTAKFVVDSNHNEITDTKTATLIIEKAKYDISGITFPTKTVTYNGQAQKVEIQGTLPEGVTVNYEYETIDGETIEGTPIDAGIYIVAAIFTGDTENHDEITSKGTFLTIEKADHDMSKIIFDDKTITYNGNKRNLKIKGILPEGVTVSYSYKDKATGEIIVGQPKDVGEYEVTAKFSVIDDKNYNAIPDKTATLTIQKETYDMSGISFADLSVEYDGEIHSLAIEGNLPNGVTVTYKNNDQKEIGTYTVIAQFTGSNNYEAIPDMTATLSITTAEINAEGIKFEGNTFTYDGNPHSIEVDESTLPEGVAFVYYENNDQTNVGDYEVTAKFIVYSSYAPIADMTATLKIEKATYNLDNIEFNDKTVTYDGSKKRIKITGELPDGVTVSYKGNAKTEAGIYEVTAKFDVADKANYNEIPDKKATLVIKKADYNMTGINFVDSTVTYDGNSHSIAISGELPEGVKVSYEYKDAEGNTIEGLPTNAGDYIVTAKFKGDENNYNEIADMTATLTIEKDDYFTVFMNFADKTVTYNGEAQKIEATGVPTGVTVSYEYKDAEGNTIEGLPTNAGTYTVIAKFEGDTDNYNAIPDMEATLTINKATYDMTAVTFAGKTVTYNGNVQKLAVEGLPEGVTAIYENNENINAGTYTITAKFAVDSNYNEIRDTKTATLKIEKATYDMTAVTFEGKTVTYDGNKQRIKITGDLPEGVTVSYNGNGKTNAGTYTVTAKFAIPDETNYNLIPDMTATLTINKATFDMTGVEFNDKELPYTGEPQTIEVTGLPEGVDVSYSHRLQVPPIPLDEAPTDKGTYVVIATFTIVEGAENYNDIPSREAILTIGKSEYDMTGVAFDNDEVEYDGQPQGLTITGDLPTGVSVNYEYKDKDGNISTNKPVNAGDYEVTAKFTGDTINYKDIEDMTATLTINKATYNMDGVEFADKTVTYDGNSYSITIDESKLPTGVTVSYEGNGQTDAETYTITAKFEGDADNYNAIPDKEATLIIEKANGMRNPDYEVPETIIVYGDNKTLADVELPDGWAWTKTEAKLVEGTNNCKANYTSANPNYTDVYYVNVVVEVMPIEVSSVTITNRPTKVFYEYGEDLDLTGGKINVVYNDDTQEEIDMTEATVTGYSSTTIGGQALKVSYRGVEATTEFNVIVNDPIVGIKVLQKPDKVVYTVNEEEISKDGMTAIMVTASGEEFSTEFGSDDINIVEFDLSKVGPSTVKVSYNHLLLGTLYGEYEILVVEEQEDTEKPMLVLNGNEIETVEVNTEYNDAGVTAYNLADDMTLVTTGTVNEKELGEYSITYTIKNSDDEDVIEPITRKVIVEDNTAPVIELSEIDNPKVVMYEKEGQTYIEFTKGTAEFNCDTAIKSVTDNYDTDVELTYDATVDSNTEGEYLVIFTARDSSGNIATKIVNVIVLDYPPVIYYENENGLKIEIVDGAVYNDHLVIRPNKNATMYIQKDSEEETEYNGETALKDGTYLMRIVCEDGTTLETTFVIDTIPAEVIVSDDHRKITFADLEDVSEATLTNAYDDTIDLKQYLEENHINTYEIKEAGIYMLRVTDIHGNSITPIKFRIK